MVEYFDQQQIEISKKSIEKAVNNNSKNKINSNSI